MNAQRGPRGTGEIESDDDEGPEASALEWIIPLAKRWKMLVLMPIVIGLATFGIASSLTPYYTSRTVFLPPQQTQSLPVGALATLGPLAGLAAGGNTRNTADQYVSLLQSRVIADKLIARFDLLKVYDLNLMSMARRKLASQTRIVLGKRDGLITIDVDDNDPKRSAAMANQYVEELRVLSSSMALTEAQLRRAYFEKLLAQTKEKLATAQQELQSSGINQGALRAEPKAVADSYARLRAEVTAAEVRLQTLRGSLSDSTPEVQQQSTTLAALRNQLSRLEGNANSGQSADYISRYREFKYQETLFELFARQYETARADEAKEGIAIQVVDSAIAPERRSGPRRLVAAVVAAAASFVLLLLVISIHGAWQRGGQTAQGRDMQARLRAALRGRAQ